MEWRPVNIVQILDKLLILKIKRFFKIFNINSLSERCAIFTGLQSIKINEVPNTARCLETPFAFLHFVF